IESKNPPTTGLKPFKTLWRDISNGKPGILKIWTGTAWESVVPDVESVKKETLDQVSKDIESTKNELNKKVQEAQNQATGQVNEVKESLQGVSRTISDVQNKQGEIDNKVTKFEQDSNGFKTSIESLTKKDSEISNKLNTVESTAEGTKKEISNIQSDTNSLKKTTTEIKEQAGKISEKLESVESNVKNINIGVRNYVLKGNQEFTFTNMNETDSKGDVLDISKDAYNDFRGKQVYLSFDAETTNLKHGTASNNSVGIELRVEYADGKTSWFEACYGKIVPEGTNRYKRYGKVSQVIEDKEIKFMRLQIFLRSASGTVKIKNSQVEISNKPSSFKLANEDQVTTDEFTKKTTEIEKSVDGVKTTVTNVQNSQAGYEKRMSNVEQTASGLSSTVSNLNNVVSDQGKKLTEANTKLEQQATAIGAKVELKQVENYVAGFKIPELKQTVDKNKQDLLGELANKLATEQFNQKMTLIDNRFIINEQGINAAAKKTEV
ncbi:hypothetical protein CN555_29970, partial [Bacillus wiedmannii]